MKVRLATLKDKKQVLLLLNQLGEIINQLVGNDPDNIRAHELGGKHYENALQRRDRRVFIVEEAGTLVAVATFFILTDFITGKPFAHIDDFVVEKEWRGKGVGTQLLDYIKQYAKNHRIYTVKLTSSLSLTKAHRFYQKRGGVFAQKVIKFDL